MTTRLMTTHAYLIPLNNVIRMNHLASSRFFSVNFVEHVELAVQIRRLRGASAILHFAPNPNVKGSERQIGE